MQAPWPISHPCPAWTPLWVFGKVSPRLLHMLAQHYLLDRGLVIPGVCSEDEIKFRRVPGASTRNGAIVWEARIEEVSPNLEPCAVESVGDSRGQTSVEVVGNDPGFELILSGVTRVGCASQGLRPSVIAENSLEQRLRVRHNGRQDTALIGVGTNEKGNIGNCVGVDPIPKTTKIGFVVNGWWETEGLIVENKSEPISRARAYTLKL